MATERVGIEINLMGYEEAMNEMRNLDAQIKGLSGRKARVQVEAEVKKLKMNRDALKAHKVKLEADTRDVERDIMRVKKSIGDLQRQQKVFMKGSPAAKGIEARIHNLKRELDELNRVKVDLNFDTRKVQDEINQCTSAIQRYEAALRRLKNSSVGQIFNKYSSAVGHFGAALQSTGNALQRLLAPWRLLTGGALLGAGYSAINKMTEGLTSGFNRYDIMKKYPRMMASLGYETEDAQKSIQKLDKSVRGLPTGLDHMVDMTQRFTLSLGDMDRGTDLAIATNNAFLASMSTETQQYQGMMQLQDLMNGKDLNPREWMSLSSSMGTAVNEIAKVFGAKSQEDIRKFRQQLNAGKIDTEDFLDALIKVGTGEGKIAQMAQESKDTWMAFSQNVTNAFSRMAAGILQSLDEITQSAFGKDLNQLMSDELLGKIDQMTDSVKKWIKANPEKITDFFDALSGVDWAGLGKGFISGLGDIASIIERTSKALEGKNLEGLGDFFSKLIFIAPMLTVGGGLIKGGRHIFGGFLTGLELLIGGITGLQTGAALKKMGVVGKILGLLKKTSKTAEAVGGAGKAAGAAGKAAGAVKAGGIFKGFLPAIEVIGGIGAVVTEILGIGWIDTKLLEQNIKNINGVVTGIKSVFDNVNALKGTKMDMGTAREAVSNMFEIYSILEGTEQAGGQAMMGARGLTRGAGGGQTKNGIGSMNPVKLFMFSKSIGFMEKAFNSISKIASSLPKISESMSQLTAYASPGSGVSGFDAIKTQISTMMTGLQDVVGSINGLGNTAGIEDKVLSVSKAISKIKTIASKLSELGQGELATTDTGSFTAIDNIKKMVNQLGQSLNTETLGMFEENVATFKESVDSIFKTLNTDLSKVEVTVVIKGKVKGDRELVSKIKQAESRIRSAVNAIKQYYYKDVYVVIRQHVNKTGDTSISTPGFGTGKGGKGSFGEASGAYMHTGGLVGFGKPLYRSKGGVIPVVMKPKGKDVIPAMLSEGEYVHKKSAVDYFGIRFMQKINNLDVKGAMRELSARVGANSVMARGMTVYNNITNNNQTVNQNVNTNNPNFAFKRSRYVAAL